VTRTRITFTDDATKPRVGVMAAGVYWYTYIRNGVLYARRFASNTLEAEIQIADPASWADVVVDPDGTTGWIVWVSDEALFRVPVTNLTTDPLAGVTTVRSDGWADDVAYDSGRGAQVSWTVNGVELLR
jgi:hypothetical protein